MPRHNDPDLCPTWYDGCHCPSIDPNGQGITVDGSNNAYNNGTDLFISQGDPNAPGNLPGNGGDYILITGRGAKGAKDGSFRFLLANEVEVLRIDPDGSFYVKGEKVEVATAVFNGFRYWLDHALVELHRNK